MDRNTIQKILIGLFLLACIFIGLKTFNLLDLMTSQSKPELNSNVSSSRMTYGRFLEYLEMGWVKQVDLYDNSRNAIVQASSPELGNRPQSIRVEIPVGASQLIQKLKEYNIDFDAHPVPQKSIFITIASNLIITINFYW
jgi:cell division protease FtsH